MSNPCLEAAVAELEQAGIRDFKVARGGRHLQLRWLVAGRSMRLLTIARSPSDWRAAHNTRRDVRKLLRLDGLLDMPDATGHSNARAGPPNNWQRQLTALARMLTRVNVPDELAEEREAIVAAMRRLADRTTEGSEP
jgi:hypothetical protein